MPEQRKGPPRAPQGQQKQRGVKPEDAERPVTTGDMQEVGATTPEEVPERRRVIEHEAPIHENPGDQNSG